MVGLGVASFGHVSGVHMQNLDKFEAYCASIEQGVLPLARALRPTHEERLIREFVLQLKLGAFVPPTSQRKYGVDVARHVPRRTLDALGRRAAAARRPATWSRSAARPAARRHVPAALLPAAAHAGVRYT